jgi:DNA polymerase V
MIVLDIVPAGDVQQNLFDGANRKRNNKLMKALDAVNSKEGKEMVKFAVQGYSTKWKLRTQYLSKCYTTRIEHILEVRD